MDSCGELFEITFFSNITTTNEEKLKEGIDSVIKKHLPIFSEGNGCLFPKYVFSESFKRDGLIEGVCNISHLTITKDSFGKITEQMFAFVNDVFKEIDSIEIATGIYELTYYLTENIEWINDFDREILSKFPFVFLRNPESFDLDVTKKLDSVSCVVNFGENVQHIFSE